MIREYSHLTYDRSVVSMHTLDFYGLGGIVAAQDKTA